MAKCGCIESEPGLVIAECKACAITEAKSRLELMKRKRANLDEDIKKLEADIEADRIHPRTYF